MGNKPKHVIAEHDELMLEWDYKKNSAMGLDPNIIGEASHTKAWWTCRNGHSWIAMISNRTKHNRGCPYCSHQLPIPGKTDLATLHPSLVKEWHPTKNRITPNEVMPGTHKKAWWVCSEGHEWESEIKSRVAGVGCPYCANKKVLKGFNDLATLNPELAKEWHPSKNGKLTAFDVTPSSGKKVWWICSNGHEFEATVYNRKAGRGCPKCSDRLRTSFPEQAIFYYIKQEFPDAVNSFKDIFNSSMELDIYIPSIKIGIEYDGKLYHSSKSNQVRDSYKYNVCKENGIRLIRIREMTRSTPLLLADHKIEIPDASDTYLNWAINNLCYHLGKIVIPDVRKYRKQILAYLNARKTSLASEYPIIASEWDYAANYPLIPENFAPHSNERVAWICKTCGTKWSAAIGDRTGEDKNGCPKCSSMRAAQLRIQNKIKNSGSLASQFPELIAEWNYEKNVDISPEFLTSGSSKKVWWICKSCGYEWESTISHRTHGRGCPYCSHRVVIPGKNDLATLNPHLMVEWDYDKNKSISLDPQLLSAHSSKKAHWICPTCGHKWVATIASRSSGSGCPNYRNHKYSHNKDI
ncbi:MAG: zinc-ribbon domain-containing protein [Clostridia bacterium]|nr:zinc-ribbon domain-containing protein [Clostridia bacterium]